MTIDEYLIKKLETIAPTYAEKPEDAEGEYLVIDVTGAWESNCLKHATVAIRSYADSLADATDLNVEVQAYMKEFGLTDPKIASCKVSTEYTINSPQMMQYKYQTIFDIIHYL